MEPVEALLKALPVAAGSPLGLVAFVAVIVAWVVVAFRVTRNRNLLERLKDLPEADRLEALRAEMGAVQMKGGLTPEQWIRSRIHGYFFAAAAILVLALVVVFVVARTTRPAGTLKADVTPMVEGQAVEQHAPGQPPPARPVVDDGVVRVANAYDGSGYGGADLTDPATTFAPDHVLEYDYALEPGRIAVRARMGYLDTLAKGGPIETTTLPEYAFKWQFPKLSIKVANNSAQTALLSIIQIEVHKSTVNVEPVIGFDDQENAFSFWNDGWGKALDTEVQFTVRPQSAGTFQAPTPAEMRVVKLGTVEYHTEPGVELARCVDGAAGGRQTLRVGEHVPPALRGAEHVTIHGFIVYRTEAGAARRLAFVAPVWLSCDGGKGAALDASFHYHVKLDAGRGGVTKNIPISQEIKPGDSDHFALRIASDKSAAYDLTLRVLDVGGQAVLEKRVALEVFVPRSAGSDSIAKTAAKVRFTPK